ncbi:uncharacterized protein C8R40DRAFT_1175084 [Lentinula edodes]|uniref:uncharacterized protein n=1 Tax=Lentinula edodes TaxID=5353 RepID=UPI001E8E2F35|nr:uncharacterized protein C8R40DRAFT_1175084 [Lentinula edodes]KAH7870858.1 hypothetical protein C8R40DRAFT_1175084 [Lentinula edodes]
MSTPASLPSPPSPLAAPTKKYDTEKTDNVSEKAPEAAILSMIVQLSSANFWMSSNGGWKGPTGITPDFTDVKLSAYGGMPDESMREVQIIADDYNTAFDQACEIQGWVAMKGAESKIGFINGASADTGTIKIKHALFEEIDDHNRMNAGDALDDYDIANTGVANALAALKAQDPLRFKLNPLPVYGEDERLIHSSMYRKKLENALVEVQFTLTHWGIRSGNDGTGAKDVYNADIIDMIVLVPPPPPIASPRKRKLPALHPSSPTKKQVTRN